MNTHPFDLILARNAQWPLVNELGDACEIVKFSDRHLVVYTNSKSGEGVGLYALDGTYDPHIPRSLKLSADYTDPAVRAAVQRAKDALGHLVYWRNPGTGIWDKTGAKFLDWHTFDFRLAQHVPTPPAPAWKLPEPPAGQRWHREDFTEADLPEGWRPLLLGEKEQREDQCFTGGTWHDDPVKGGATHKDNKRRTRRPFPSAPVMVPWGFESAPDRLKVRCKKTGAFAAATLAPDGYNVFWSTAAGDDEEHTFISLFSDFVQLDGSPCGKESK